MKGYAKFVTLIVNGLNIGNITFDKVEVAQYTKQYIFRDNGFMLCKFNNEVVKHNLKFDFISNDVKCIYYILNLTK